MINNIDILINILINLSFLSFINFIFIYNVIDNKLNISNMKGLNFIGNALSFIFIVVISIMAVIGSIMFLGFFGHSIQYYDY